MSATFEDQVEAVRDAAWALAIDPNNEEKKRALRAAKAALLKHDADLQSKVNAYRSDNIIEARERWEHDFMDAIENGKATLYGRPIGFTDALTAKLQEKEAELSKVRLYSESTAAELSRTNDAREKLEAESNQRAELLIAANATIEKKDKALMKLEAELEATRLEIELLKQYSKRGFWR